jgi:methanogenic corrinoid protein MtbC1
MEYDVDPATAPVTRMALLAALVDGDLDTAYRVATRLLDEGVPFESLVAQLLGPVQREVGTRWAGGDLSVADEHAATASVEALVALLAAGFAPAAGPLVVVACPEGDAHALPARVVAVVLALRDFRTAFLGASLPAWDLGDYLERQPPLAVAVSISMPAALYRAAASITVAHAHGVPVLVGGRAVPDPGRAAALGADTWAATPANAADVLGAWADRPPGALAPDPAPHPECAAIDRHRFGLLAAAFPPEADDLPARVADELVRILDVLQGALLLGEPALVAEHVAFLRSIDPDARAPVPALEAALDRLVAAAEPAVPVGADVLAAARAG